MGGMGGGLGGNLGQMFAPDASAATQGLLGSGLAGAVGGMASGRGPLEGAVQGALGSYIGNAVGGMGGSGAVGTGLAAGSENFRNAMVAGYDPQTALTSGALSGLAAGMRKPSQTAVDSLGQTAKPTSGSASSGFGFDKLGALLPFAVFLSSGSSDAQQAVKSMSP